jgi:hypothetical protein
MKVLSWDVGVLNLAYCLINYKENDFEILDWDIINLTDREKLKCKVCKKNASVCNFIDNNQNFYCKTHYPKNIEIPKFNNYFNDIRKKCYLCNKQAKYTNEDKYSCNKHYDNLAKPLINQCHCGKNAFYKYNNTIYCTQHAKSQFKKITNQYKVIPVKKTAVGQISIDDLRKRLVEELENRKIFMEANVILIENQPTLKNPKMKAISSTIYDYFLIRGIFDKEWTKSKIDLIKYMSPSNKIKIADDGDQKKIVKLKGQHAKSYKLTKNLAIKYCSILIEPFESWKNHFNKYKKKDDLADALLQGMYYYNNVVKKIEK